MRLPHSARLAAALSVSAGMFAVPADADTVIVADRTVENVTAYGSTAAWSRLADDGTWRLVVRSAGVVEDAAVASSPQPFDPDLGPTKTNGRVAVYSRCTTPHRCDVFAYDVGNRSETRVAAISKAATSELAPSFYKGLIAFGRRGGSKPGLYVYRPGHAAKRITSRLPAETDISGSRVVWLYHPGAPSGGETFVRLTTLAGSQQRTLARATVNGAGEGDRLVSPTLSRFNAFWLRVAPLEEKTLVQRVGVNAHRGLTVLTASRVLDGTLDSLAVTSAPVLYSGADGITTVDPALSFAG